jgi:hypothetical protein
MPANGDTVRPSLRKILADSHISAVAIAVLLFWSLESLFLSVGFPLYLAASSLFCGFITHSPVPRTLPDRDVLNAVFWYLVYAFIYFVAASLLSQWVHGEGPFRTLGKYRIRLARRNHA